MWQPLKGTKSSIVSVDRRTKPKVFYDYKD